MRLITALLFALFLTVSCTGSKRCGCPNNLGYHDTESPDHTVVSARYDSGECPL